MTLTTGSAAAGHRPDIVALAPSDAIPDALVLAVTTVAGSVEGDAPSARCIYVTDDDTLGFVAEGADITEDAPTLAEKLVHTGKLAQYVSISREQYGQATTSGLLSESVVRAVTRKANSALLSQVAPTSPAVTPPAGLLTQATQDDGAVEGNLDAIVDSIAAIEADGGQATHILAAPDAWARLRRLKTATGSEMSLLGAGTDDAERRLLGVPVLTSSAVPTGKLVVLDRAAIVSAVGQVQIATSEHILFQSDSVALRVTFRFGAAIVRANRVRKLSIAEPA